MRHARHTPSHAPASARRGSPAFAKASPAYLYRDRRRRLRRVRWLRRVAVLAAALALILLIARLVRPRAPRPTPSPTHTLAPMPSPTPEATPLPYSGVVPPMADITDEADLIDLYWWMIQTGHETVYLNSLGVWIGDVADIIDKFSNYFDRFNAMEDPPAVRVQFKPGLRALQALQAGDTSVLTEDEAFVAERAQAVVDELIRPGMTDWEKELALHDYVVDHCQYTLDILAPHSGDALGFFRYGECRCAGYCDTFRLLGRLAGLEVEMIGGATSRDENGSKGHAWNLVWLDGLWYVVDTAWDDMIEAEPTLEHTFFNVPLAAFGDSRSCDEACLPDGELAVTLDDNYFFNRAEYKAQTTSDAVASAIRQLDASGRAYLMLPDREMAQDVAAALKQHYGRRGSCYELSEDLDFNLFRFKM